MDDATLARFADLVIGFGANVQPDQIVADRLRARQGVPRRARSRRARTGTGRSSSTSRGSTRTSSARGSSTPARGHARLRAALVRRAHARARRAARRADRAVRPDARRACSPTSTRCSSARTGCRHQGGHQGRQRPHDELDDLPVPDAGVGRARLPRARAGRARSRGSSSELLHVLRLDEEDPIAVWRARADTLVSERRAALGAALRRAALRGPRHRHDDRAAAVVAAGRRRASRPSTGIEHMPNLPDRGGLHDPGPRAHRGRRDLHQAARPDRRHGRARPRRPLRARPRGRGDRVGGRRDAAHDHRDRRRRRAGWASARSSTARAASASWGRSSTTRCSTRTRPATSRSARASRSSLDDADRDRANRSQIHIDFMIGSDELRVTGITERRRARAGARRAAAGRSDPATLLRLLGEVPERLNGHDWKSCDGGQPRPRVRIPPSPLEAATSRRPPRRRGAARGPGRAAATSCGCRSGASPPGRAPCAG